MSRKVDVEQVSKTYHLLASFNGIVRWGARNKDTIEGAWAGNAAELVQFAEAYADWDFYVQLNPSERRHGRRCRTEDIAAWEWFVVDLDPEGDYVPDERALFRASENIEKAMHNYLGHKFDALRVYSGRGMQMWFRVGKHIAAHASVGGMYHEFYADADFPIHAVDLWQDPPISVQKVIKLRDAITCAQRYWLGQLGTRVGVERIIVDPSVSDLPRLMRCPGTYNRKTGKQARSYFYSGTDVQKNLGRLLLKYTPKDRLWPAPAVGQDGVLPEGAPWQAAGARINMTAANTITFGATEPGRHRAMCAAARALAEVGISEVEIVKALTLAGSRSRPELLDPEYIARTARDAAVRFGKYPVDTEAGS